MNRTNTNLWLDLVTFLAMLGLFLTGGLMYFVMPPGTGHSLRLLGLSRHDYGTLHFWIAVALILLLTLHVALHWNFVCSVIARSANGKAATTSRKRRWAIAALAVAFVLPSVLLVWASTRLEYVGSSRGPAMHHR